MSHLQTLQVPASPTGFGLPGCWSLAPDRAITVDAHEPGSLRIDNGTIWATLDGPHVQGAANEWGDLVLGSGAQIHLTPGQHVVIESIPAAANEEACFHWEPDAVEAAPSPSLPARLWRGLRKLGAWTVSGLGEWLEPGPGWPRSGEDWYAVQRDIAWRKLYHLGINQP